MSSIDTPATTTAAPNTVTASYWLYVVGAIIGVIGAIVLLIALPASLANGSDAVNEQLQGRSTNGVDVGGAVAGFTVAAAVFSTVLTLAFSILTVVFARRMRQGRNWARIVLAVFAAAQLFGILGPFGVGALHFVIVIVALILSFLPASNTWFRTMRPAPASTF